MFFGVFFVCVGCFVVVVVVFLGGVFLFPSKHKIIKHEFSMYNNQTALTAHYTLLIKG